MDTNQRIRQLMKERGLTEYRLALDSGLSKSTVSALLHRNTTPSVPTIEAVCNALGITVSQFFAEEGDSLPVNEEQRLLLQRYAQLTETQKRIIQQTMLEFLR
ncbi:MAG: helix-turn-helix transcriptional regulator [Gemmiger sp.]|uniref:Helix-turn-helix transcriptional regulator n=1 Tax=Subdoligranulum variabile TaxID=214851 RepID=A0A921IKT4_9FIRM|nr:helix-turn-helix transcriptional regulator [Gemmiger sp.]MEE0709446.1 helix-turn-helix transcriptional regulator [Gemmiger sp.]HJG27593.1 helix-turn-helix transcriptional regulator [Subdoligranulum variabile]